MNNEFTKIKSGNYVRYVLEDGGSGGATSGGTSSGSIASMDTPIGKDQIVVQSRMGPKEPPKPRNFVAKNAKMGGAGKMKDKSKTLPRHEKHKKPVAEALGMENPDHEASMARNELYRNAKYGIAMLKMIEPGQQLEGWVESCLTKAASSLDKIFHYLDYETKFGQGVDHSDEEPEVDVDEDAGEADMARENLMLIVEYSTKLFKMIKDGDDLEGWVFMKLTKASECVSSAKHHLEYEQFKNHGLDDEYSDEQPVAESSNRGYQHGFASPTAPSLGQRRRDHDRGDDEPQGMFMVMIDGRPWKEFTSNTAFERAKAFATKNPDRNVQVRWPSGQLNTIKEQGVAEGLHPMVAADLEKLKTLNPVDRYSAYGNIRGYFKADPALSKMASDLIGGYYEADMLRGKYKTDAANAKYKELEPMHQAFIKQALSQEQGVAEGLNEGKGLEGELARFLKSNGFKGPYRLGKLPKWAAELSEFDKTALIMVQGDDVEYDEFVVDIGYGILYWGAEGGMTKMTEKAIVNHIKLGQQGVAEGDSVAKYKIKQIGSEGGKDYYISPNTGKKVYKTAQVGDHETPNGEHKPKLRMPYKEGDYNDYLAGMLENVLAERSKSKAQWDLMHAVAHNPQFANQVKIKPSVGQEFSAADAGHERSALPDRVLKKNKK